MATDNNDDLLVFSEDPSNHPVRSDSRKWKVLIVDDEQEVHAITTLVLRDFQFEDHGLEFIHAYSSQEARAIIKSTTGIAIILLDVVMESDHAGLDLVRWIREETGDSLVRIILRTGQPGAAPEKDIISRYDINDYKEKTELTDTKLWTTITVALRCYRDLTIINRSRSGLEKIVRASVTFTERQSIIQFFQGVLTQMTSLLRTEEDSLMLRADGLAVKRGQAGFQVIAGTGRFTDHTGGTLEDIADARIHELVDRSVDTRASFFDGNWYLAFLEGDDGAENIIILNSEEELNRDDQEIIRVFIANVSIALINITMTRAIEESQSEMIFTLGEVVESRSIETGNHVKRVAALGALLAERSGMPAREVELVKYALPLHDIGKIGIADAILNKPGRLSDLELMEMRKHTLIGYNLLNGGSQRALQIAATIALTHHERWDGSGYPQGLKGADIPLIGRITALVDVFDALLFARIYKPAWEWDMAVKYLVDGKGTQFDPQLVDIFCQSLSDIRSIVDQFKSDGDS